VNGNGIAAGALARQDAFGGQEMVQSTEVQAQALSAQAEAEVKARWAIAQRNPRNLDGVRVALLRECDRPGFADVAKYAKPVGGSTVVGPSIRFVEAALRCMGNVIASTTLVAEDARTRRLQVMVTDLETNVSWPRQITIEKTVERGNANGRTVLSERLNTSGKKSYLVVATEDELANKEAAAVSKAIRTAGLRVIPGDLIEEAMRRVDEVRTAKVKQDPAGERKRLVDAFAGVGVAPEQLVEYLGHGLDFCQPAELVELRDTYAAIRDGETTWRSVMAERAEPTTAPAAPVAPSPPPDAWTASGAAAVGDPRGAAAPKPTPTPPQAPPLDPAKGVDEVAEVQRLIAEAKSGKELAQLGTRIIKLPADKRPLVMPQYQARSKELGGAK
jgi:hypothetical protein